MSTWAKELVDQMASDFAADPYRADREAAQRWALLRDGVCELDENGELVMVSDMSDDLVGGWLKLPRVSA